MDVPTLKPKANIDHIVEFLYDNPREGTNDYGVYHRYAFKYNGDEVGLFATDALHSKLAMFHKGDRVNIRKEEYEPGKFGFNVIPEEGTPIRNGSTPEGIDDSYKAEPNASEKERRNYYASKTDDKTKDIHRQVCLKLAVQSMGTPEVIDFEMVKVRMEGFLIILDGLPLDESVQMSPVLSSFLGTDNDPPPIDDDDLLF